MTYKQIEQSRELRLWLTQVVIPTAGIAVLAMSRPEVRTCITKKYETCKETIKEKFKRNKE